MTTSREELIDEVGRGFDNYNPNERTLSQLTNVDLTIVTGPAGMGKDTIINRSGLPRVVADTIREPRPNNGVTEQDGIEYYFRGNELDAVLADFRDCKYVQIGMGPNRKSFYATRAESYPSSGPALMDLMASQVDTMRRLPFASVQPVQVTVRSYEQWLSRLRSRGHLAPEDWAARRDEAIASITQALEDSDFIFILNSELKIAASALSVVAYRRHAESAERIDSMNRQARKFAAGILKTLEANPQVAL